MRLNGTWLLAAALSAAVCYGTAGAEASEPQAAIDHWKARAPRDEIRPEFSHASTGGREDSAVWSIAADDREGLFGWWEATVPVEGGKYYRFQAWRKLSDVSHPRRVAVARIMWRDAAGNPVRHDAPSYASYRPGERPRAEPEFPADGSADPAGWVPVEGTYLVPSEARQAVIELSYRWAPAAKLQWSQISLRPVPPPQPRKVRLATIHYRPSAGDTARDKCEQFAPLIAEAARRRADLVVLPETLTFYGRGKTYAECAEPIPGPSSDYFARLAKKHDLYVVAGLLERERHLVYNVAVLLGPDGSIVGKYRKVTLPRGEVEGGITPGDEYPVFPTRFGKVGMMICYDGFFPEVARELSNRGAEVIAWPVWGCNPLLGSARACENHVYVVSSTYTGADQDWMISAVYGHDGKPLAQARKWGEVSIAEVDLNQPLHWQSLGDFKAQLLRHRPIVKQSSTAD